MSGRVVAVSANAAHSFSKLNQPAIHLLAGLGVEGDAHMGTTVQHRWARRKNAAARNLTQVHLLHAELHQELALRGFMIAPGAMGENVTTRGVDLLSLPVGAGLRLGEDAVVEVTGLREPCTLLNRFAPGLMNAVLDRDADGRKLRKAGIMGIVLVGGWVRPGDNIDIYWPPQPWVAMGPV